MYVPSHFEPDDSAVQELLSNHGIADLVTATGDGLLATPLPLVYDREQFRLLGHVARNNPHWQTSAIGDALVIMRGPDAYVSPSWYASKGEHGRVVPTWNYVTAHIYGALTVHDDPQWIAPVVRQLTELHETNRPQPWSVDDAPEKFLRGQLRAIVGVEITIGRIEAKFKLSQNKSADDIDGVISGLTRSGDIASATAVAQNRRRI